MRSPLAAPVLALAALAALASTPASQTPLRTELVAAGLEMPVAAAAPAGDPRLFVAEQRGKIRVVAGGAVQPQPFLDLSALVSQSGSERGLLGLAFDPAYAQNGFVYVCYTEAAFGLLLVERYRVSSASPDVADPGSATLLLGPLAQPFPNHQGGCLAFGADGKLYVSLGDGGGSGDPVCNAQDGQSLLGKLLRLERDGSVPADNPFVGDAAVRDEVWALGLRNPWRFSFDRATGDLYLGDVGQNAREEIDFQPAASPGGENYGWKVMEGLSCFGTSFCAPATPACGDPGYTRPILDFGTYDGGGCAVIGGYVYRGCAIPDLEGTYFYADYCSGRISSLRYDGVALSGPVDRTAELATPGVPSIELVTSFGEDGRGELVVLDAVGGEVFRIAPAAPAPFTDLGFGKPGTGGVAPALDVCGLLTPGMTAVLRLRGALPGAPAVGLVSASTNPLTILGGTIVQDLLSGSLLAFTADQGGALDVPLEGLAAPLSAYAQLAVLDPGAFKSIAFSNAIQLHFGP